MTVISVDRLLGLLLLLDPNCCLDFAHFGYIGLPLGSYCDVMVHQGSRACLSPHLICLLREDFLHFASYPNLSAGPLS